MLNFSSIIFIYVPVYCRMVDVIVEGIPTSPRGEWTRRTPDRGAGN
jgi:hypothetical protein